MKKAAFTKPIKTQTQSHSLKVPQRLQIRRQTGKLSQRADLERPTKLHTRPTKIIYISTHPLGQVDMCLFNY